LRLEKVRVFGQSWSEEIPTFFYALLKHLGFKH